MPKISASLIALSIALAFCLMPSASLAGSQIDAEVLFNQIYAIERAQFESSRDRANAISLNYERFFHDRMSSRALRVATTRDLGFLLQAAHLSALHTLEPICLSDIRSVLAELEVRQIATNEQRRILYRALIGYREFGEARSYLAAHPTLDVEQVPAIGTLEGGDGPLVYKVSPDRFELTPQRRSVSKGTVLVVVAHPLCAFSRHAMEAIASDPQISSALEHRTLWLAPVDLDLHFRDVQEWNRTHPATSVVIARMQQDWPVISNWATPSFYLLHDGQLIGKFSGWPKDGGNRAALVDLLMRGGLLPQASAVGLSPSKENERR